MINHISLLSRVSTGDSICGQSELTAGQGTIRSPNYPYSYPINTQCSWVITAPTDQVTRHIILLSKCCEYLLTF